MPPRAAARRAPGAGRGQHAFGVQAAPRARLCAASEAARCHLSVELLRGAPYHGAQPPKRRGQPVLRLGTARCIRATRPTAYRAPRDGQWAATAPDRSSSWLRLFFTRQIYTRKIDARF